MGSHLKPDYRKNKAFEIDAGFLADAGITALVIDIDNTLVPWRGEEPDSGAVAWIESLKSANIKLVLVSNAGGPRASRMGDRLGISAIAPAKKPLKSGFLKALKALGTKPEETAAVGDQIFTDVLGANRCGIKTILVDPFSEREFVATRIMRYFEKRLGR